MKSKLIKSRQALTLAEAQKHPLFDPRGAYQMDFILDPQNTPNPKTFYVYHTEGYPMNYVMVIVETSKGFLYDWSHPCNAYAKTLEEAEEIASSELFRD
jgi:hypothetical protein